MKAVINFSIEKELKGLIKNNLRDIKLFFIIFVVNIIIYGQKLFFYTLATDDFERFYSGGGEQASRLGRWMAGILNQHIFTGALHVLPYLNGMLGIFSFTLAGFLTAKYFKRSNSFEIFMITLLSCATPMIAHNLYFNTNISTWLSTLVGVIGLLLAYKSSKIVKLFGFALLVLAIGCYQTIIQVALAMIIIRAIMDVMEAKEGKELQKIVLNTTLFIIFVLLAFVASNFINYLYMEYNHLEVTARLKTAENIGGLSIYIERIVKMYHHLPRLQYFNNSLIFLYKLMALFAMLAALFAVFKNKNLRIPSTVLLLLLFLAIPLIVNLPLITGNRIPLRAHYAIGWFMAGFFTIQFLSFNGIFKTITIFIATSVIILSTYYINVFFDAGSRQTNSDIIRANQIVNRIRTRENYTAEPLHFKIVGKKAFPAVGWNSYQQALNTIWSKYGIFKNFTDFEFVKMNDKEYADMRDYLIKRGQKIGSYPAKNSIVVYQNKAILFLKAQKINSAIKLNNIKLKHK